MIDALIRFSLRTRSVVLMVSVVLLIAGGFTMLRMPVDVFPDLTAPTVTVLVEGHGMAPEEMETLVTFPIETAVNGASRVRRVRSATSTGIAVVWVEFDWGTDIFRARQTVTERLATVVGSLPEEVEPPVLAPVSSLMGEVFFFALTSDEHTPMELRTAVDTSLRRRLLSVTGVAQVTPIGGEVRQLQVVLSPDRLFTHNLGVQDVADALRAGNKNASAGILVEGGGESLVRGIGRVRGPEDIEQIVVALRGTRPILVKDLGLVQIGPALRRGAAAASFRDEAWDAHSRDGILVAVQKQPGANTLELTEELDRVLDQAQASLPEGMFLQKDLFRQSTFIENSIEGTTSALLEGALMVVLVVVFFLVSGQASLITLLAIPMSLVIAILVLRMMGASINTMTLGGMAIAIGALVDDAIIDVENVVRRLRENRALPEDQRRSAFDVVLAASVEVRASIVFATFIILLVFAPLFFLSGVEGRLLRPLGVAFCVSLAASLATALTLTPALCLSLLPNSRTVRSSAEPALIGALKRFYSVPLRLAMKRPLLITVPSAAMLVAALVAAAGMGRDFLPTFNEGALVVGAVTLPGTSLEESNELARVIERELMREPEVQAIGRRTGRAEEDEHVLGVEASEFEITLDMDAPERLGLPRRSMADLTEALRGRVAGLPGVQVTFGQPLGHRIDHMLSGTRASIAVKIFGENLEALRDLAAQIEGLMEEVEGVVDLSTEAQSDVPQFRVEFRRDALAHHGLRLDEVADALQAAHQGLVVGQVFEGRLAYDLVLLLESESVDRDALTALGELPVETPAGARVPLRALADIVIDRGPNFISREDVQRKIVVMCNVAGRDVSSVVADIQEQVDESVALAPGYRVEYGGQFETAEATSRRLAWLGALVVLGIGFLLNVVFRSVRDSLLVMLNLPLALVGGVLGVWISGGVMNVATTIGFISLFGIAARNGIMLVSHVRHLQAQEGVADFAEAVRRGSLERLAPILMTALASGLALIPLALRQDQSGTEILAPMALVILFGLLSSTVLNMLVVPALLLRFGRPATA